MPNGITQQSVEDILYTCDISHSPKPNKMRPKLRTAKKLLSSPKIKNLCKLCQLLKNEQILRLLGFGL